MIGDRLTLDVGAVAHGGTCVARHDGRVVFVRHALPGERVVAVVTEGKDGDRYLRADAVEVLDAAEGRVQAGCPHARPGGCGGCDWQHADLRLQRELKAFVVSEQLRRLAKLEVDVVVEPVGREASGADGAGTGWRTRVSFGVDAGGALGLRRARSHELEVIDSCPIAHPAINAAIPTASFPGATAIHVTALDEGGVAVVARDDNGRIKGRAGPDAISRQVHGRRFAVAADGFWQVHPAAATTLVDAVMAALRPAPGEHALDLFAGVGLFSAFLAEAVGPGGAVTAVEGSPRALRFAASNLEDLPQVATHRASVDEWLRKAPGRSVDVVVLDPPRKGATRAVLEPLVARTPRAIAYVACDPAALARDAAILAVHGYRLDHLRAFDLFPMTHHVECVASFVPA